MVEGVAGQATSHRSVLSEHRAEDDARAAASLERSRLEVIYGDNAGDWRVLVLRDDEVVHREIPAGATVPSEITGEILLPPAPDEPEGEEPPPGADEAPQGGDEEPVPEQEPVPEGPVPDWVLAKFEESIARRADREDEEPPAA